ncbi:1267_t:CDS:2 [Entrophospora sp. SA101]|nr:14821_t:CDS:2 [Entrophospora sp. SA101]CAJ0634319.1 1267_t:CDS:2 [Entrophospora sp. SA101]
MLKDATLIKQGAEARIYIATFLTRKTIVKERFKKTYRHPILDKKLTSKRVVQEARCLFKCYKSGINTPVLYFVDLKNSTIYMEFVEGKTIKDIIISLDPTNNQHKDDLLEKLIKKIGESLAKMHLIDVIHGDLTTSNLMLRENSEGLAIIDFGLSYVSNLPEDKAVDLYVLEKSFQSTHPTHELMFNEILKVYEKNHKNSKEILNKLMEVRLRGRKRSMIG